MDIAMLTTNNFELQIPELNKVTKVQVKFTNNSYTQIYICMFVTIFMIILQVAFVASHAARTFEDYWRSVLPDTPLPKSISGLLQSPG